MTRKIVSGNHCGVSFFISIEDHGGKYKAQSTITFQDFAQIIDWNEQGKTNPVDFTECKGNHFFYEWPEKALVCSTTAFIDAANDMTAIKDKIAAGGDIGQISHAEAQRQIKRLSEMAEEAKLMQQKIRPETDPTPEQLQQMREQIEKLVSIFTMTGLASITGNSRQTVNGWLARGRVSAQAAHHMCQLDEIKAHGFTRESIRPDVKFWYI